MCRNIKTSATHDEIRDAALQFVRKLSGTTKPSRKNEEVFNRAVDQIAEAAHELLHSMETHQHPRNREEEAAKAKARSALRFASA